MDGFVTGVALTSEVHALTAPSATARTRNEYSLPPCNPDIVISFAASPKIEVKSPI
jgi:hypothetical protein